MLNIGSPSLCRAEGLSISLSGGALIFPWSSGSLSVAEKYTVRYKGGGGSSEINLLKMLPYLKRKDLYALDARWINNMKIQHRNASHRLRHKFPPETQRREFTKWQDRTLTGQCPEHTPSYEVKIQTESFKLWNYHGQLWMYFRIVGWTVQGTLTDASRAATT